MVHLRRFPELDTEPHPVFQIYSSGNYGEVAPLRLSPMSWSLVGVETERAVRDLLHRVNPSATWMRGPAHCFTGYFSCRPYHNVAGFCRLAGEIVGVGADDVTSSYFESVSLPSVRAGRSTTSRRLVTTARLVGEWRQLAQRMQEVEGRTLVLEASLGRCAEDGFLATKALLEARECLRQAWDIHLFTTISLVAIRAWHLTVGSRIVADWRALESALVRPDPLDWDLYDDAARLDLGVDVASFLRTSFYEVAEAHDPWSEWAKPRRLTPSEPATSTQAPPSRALEIGDAFWDIVGTTARTVRPLVRLAGAGMAARERTKAIVMRNLHAIRCLLPPVAAARGLDEMWPYLSVRELCSTQTSAQLRRRAEVRRDDVLHALKGSPPDLLSFGDGVDGDFESVQGRGVSPGRVTGYATTKSMLLDALPTQPVILVAEALDADVTPLMGALSGILTARGSALSHLAALSREYRVPTVVAHPLARRLTPGQRITIDGTTGEAYVNDPG